MKSFLVLVLSVLTISSSYAQNNTPSSSKIKGLLTKEASNGISSNQSKPELDNTSEFINTLAEAAGYAENGGKFNATVTVSNNQTYIENLGDDRITKIQTLLEKGKEKQKEINIKAIYDVQDTIGMQIKNTPTKTDTNKELDKLYKILNSDYGLKFMTKGSLNLIEFHNKQLGQYLSKIVDSILKGDPIKDDLKKQTFKKISSMDLLRQKMDADDSDQPSSGPISFTGLPDDKMTNTNMQNFYEWVRINAGKPNKIDALNIVKQLLN